MNARGKQRGECGRLLHVAVVAIAILAMLPLTATGAAAQATTTITLTSFAGDGTTPGRLHDAHARARGKRDVCPGGLPERVR